MKLPATFLGVVLATAAWAAEPAPVTFAKPPVATKTGAGVKITFVVNRPTDVAVFVEDAKGRVVRHLVAGMLGPNAPAPLAKHSLSQSIHWDGKADYGKPAGGGPFRVRVAIGLGAAFDRVLMEDPLNFTGGKGGVKALAVGPEGTLYVLASFAAAVPNWSGERIVALNRDGSYNRTVHPFPSCLTAEQLGGYDTIEIAGRAAPLVRSIAGRSLALAGTGRKTAMAVTPDGVILRPTAGLRLSAVGVDGGTPYGKETGPLMLKLQPGYYGRVFLCAASDGRRAYVAGLGYRPLDPKTKRRRRVPFPAVYRVPLPARAPAVRFFGDGEKTGSDNTHLGGLPSGLALDGKGNVLIGDTANGRVVVVSEKSGGFVGSFNVERPDHVAADPNTGAVYVTRILKDKSVELVKFKSWKDAAVVARRTLRREGNPDFPWVMAADVTQKPVVVWMGSDAGSLVRIEDQGDTFGAPVRVNRARYGNAAFVDLHVDRFRADREVYARCGQGNWYRFNERTGKITNVRCPLPSSAGSCIAVGPTGYLYCVGWPYHLFRFTRAGKPLAWPADLERYPKESVGKTGKLQKVKPGPTHGRFSPTSMTYMTHTLSVRHDGHLFVLEPGHFGGRPPKMLVEFTPDGRKVDRAPIIWCVSDTAIGPEFDAAGNLYIAEQVKPIGRPYPPEFVRKFGRLELGKNQARSRELKGIHHQVATMYGSIVKFTPKGGMFDFGAPFKHVGKALDLAPSLKTVMATSFHGNRLYPLRVTGAEWIRMGISHVDLFYCNCENTRFDVDEFGRVFYPDLGRFRVGVLDTNGNEIAHFGGYGNADNRGPESPCLDPRTGRRVEARVNPYATPDLAFAWLIGVGVTDRFAYMGDSLNRRLLRARLTYAAEATCEVQ